MKRRTAADTRVRKSSSPGASANSDQCDASITALDALPARIAVLDREGRVIIVNRAWREFAARAQSKSDRAAAGDNYLEICESEHANAPHLSELADGISAVLDGRRPEFALE